MTCRKTGCCPSPQVQVTHHVVAASMDFAFTAPFTGGETIAKAGTVIAMDSGCPVVTPYDDCMLVMPSLRQLRTEVTTAHMEKGCDPIKLGTNSYNLYSNECFKYLGIRVAT